MATARKTFGVPDDTRSKKYDDPRSLHPGSGSGLSSVALFRWLKTVRRRRIVFSLLAVFLLYFFIRNIPTDLPPVAHRYDHFGPQRLAPPHPPPDGTTGPSSSTAPSSLSDHPERDYDGPVKFYKLAASLPVYRISPQDHVLFAFSNLKSASPVMSAACSMACQNRSRVHVALMGRQYVNPIDLLALNNIPENECSITWHDAQPDHPDESTQERMQLSAEFALGHIHKALPQQAVFIDHSHREDEYFRTAIKARSRLAGIPIINLPHRDAWVLALDAHSIRQWNTVSVDIVVRAPSESSANLIRLMKSLQRADYRGLTYPKLTIELPAIADQPLLEYIARYQWPPRAPMSERTLTVRRRPDPKLMGATTASLSTLESFYPIALQSHVLVLSPDVELASSYYQSLLYLLLEYQYGARNTNLAPVLLGVSLESLNTKSANNGQSLSLTQTPNGKAALYFADKWNELHDFVTLRIQSDPEWKKVVDADLLLPLVSNSSPAWMTAASEMMQAQGYFMLQLSAQKGNSPLVTVHQELAHDFDNKPGTSAKDQPLQKDDLELFEEGTILTGRRRPGSKDVEEPIISISSVSSMFPFKDDSETSLPTFQIYDALGKLSSWDAATEHKTLYRAKFAVAVGGCSAKSTEGKETTGITALFCD